MSKLAMVKEIQVCGGRNCESLFEACVEFLMCVKAGTDRAKLNFVVKTTTGEVKSITFRQEDDGIHVYGDFEGMPNMLEWSRIVIETR